MRTTCPFCRLRLTLDAGHLPDHNGTGRHGTTADEECPGANLPPWAARLDRSAADAEEKCLT